MEWFSLFALLCSSVALMLTGGAYLLPLGLFAALLAALLFRTVREQARSDFLNQVRSSRRELRAGATVIVNGELITPNSVLTTYSLTIGGGLCSVKIPSQYHVKSDPSEALLYSCLSLLLGWCSLPTGPMHAFAAITTNLLGGEELSIAKLIATEPRYNPALSKRLPPEPNPLLSLIPFLFPPKEKPKLPEHPSKLPEQLEEIRKRREAEEAKKKEMLSNPLISTSSKDHPSTKKPGDSSRK